MKNPLGKLIITGMRHLDEVPTAERVELLEAGAAVLETLESGQTLAASAMHTAAVIRESESMQMQFLRLLKDES